MPRPPQLPDKLFFRIGEVAEIVGVRAHVLRYWEEEFGVLKPMKTRGAHRQYRRRDVELALIIKKLLHEEGFTVAGARKRLREMGHLEVRAEAGARATRELAMRADLLALRAELSGLLSMLDAAATAREASAAPRSEPTSVVSADAEITIRVESARRER